MNVWWLLGGIIAYTVGFFLIIISYFKLRDIRIKNKNRQLWDKKQEEIQMLEKWYQEEF